MRYQPNSGGRMPHMLGGGTKPDLDRAHRGIPHRWCDRAIDHLTPDALQPLVRILWRREAGVEGRVPAVSLRRALFCRRFAASRYGTTGTAVRSAANALAATARPMTFPASLSKR